MMKQLKGFFFVLGGLGLLILLISLLMPSRVRMARSVVIHAGSAKVFAEIADLENWKNWHPLFMYDSNAVTISNPSSGLNAFAEWNINGKRNKFLITSIAPNEIRASLIRSNENDIENILSVSHISDNNSVQVEWRTLVKLKWYPWEKFYGMFIDKLTGPGYETALNNLKNFFEK